MEKQKQEAGFGDMPPPYSTEGHPADTGYPPGYSAGPHQVPPPGSNFATPQGLYAQQAPYVTPGRTTVVTVVPFPTLRSRSTRLTCPHCRADVSTRINYSVGRFTHIAALVACLICCPCGIFPYCINECQDVEHYCPNCQQYIGIYRR